MYHELEVRLVGDGNWERIYDPSLYLIRVGYGAFATAEACDGNNIGNFLRTLALPEAVSHWSMATLQDRLVKIRAKTVRHGCSITFHMAEVVVPRGSFQQTLDAITALRPLPPARC